MDAIGISKSVLSISSPGTHLVQGNKHLAFKVTRYCNEYAARLKRDHPERFGYFASLPLPDFDLAMEEIERASNEGADGFCLLTNAHGHYIGDSILDPIFDELNRRKAIVFIHPTTPCIACESGATKATPNAGKWPFPWTEFFFDTARVVTNLFMYGTVERCPDIRWIIPHCGGAVPPLLTRFSTFSSMIRGPWKALTEEEVIETLKRQFYFDLAGLPFPSQLRGLLATGVDASRLFYGTDYCFTPFAATKMLAEKMDEGVKGLFNEEEIEQIYSGNARRLLLQQ